MVECHIRTVPSSEPVIIIGSSGWKHTAETLCVWPSRVWTQVLVSNSTVTDHSCDCIAGFSYWDSKGNQISLEIVSKWDSIPIT